MKKFKLMLVAFMAMVGVNASAQSYSNSTFTYFYDGVGCTITGLNEDVKNTITNVPIPETVLVNGVAKPVTGIGDAAFKGITQITTVSVAKNVKTIGNEAFSGCVNLATLDLSAATALESLGNFVFGGTPSLTSISFENCAKLVDFGSFYYDALSAAAVNALLDGAVEAGDDTGEDYDATTAAAYNAQLEGAISTTTVLTAAQAGTLNGISGVSKTDYAADDSPTADDAILYNAELDGAVTNGDDILYDAVSAAAKNATLDGAVAAGDYAGSSHPFIAGIGKKNNYLTSVTLNANTTQIGNAFQNIPNLATLNISGTKLAALRAYALDGNTKITELELPNTVKDIEAGALTGSKVTSLTIKSSSTVSANIAGAVGGEYLASLTFAGEAFAGNIAAGSFTLAEAGTLTFGEIAAGATIADGAITVAGGKTAGDITIGNIKAGIAGLFTGNCGAVTVGQISANVPVTAFGTPTSITFGDVLAAGKLTGTMAANLTLTSLTFGAIAGEIGDGTNATFGGATKLATITFNGLINDGAVKSKAFAEAGKDADAVNGIKLNVAYNPTGITATTDAPFNAIDVFSASAGALIVKIGTTADVRTAQLAATGALNKVDFGVPTPAPDEQTISVAKNSGDFYYGKFIAPAGTNYAISADDAVVYSAYVDGENIYMDALQIVDGEYVVAGGEAVVIKNKTGEDVTATATGNQETMRYAYDAGLGAYVIVNDITWEGEFGNELGDPAAVIGYEIIDNLAAGKAAYAMAKPEKYNLSWKTFKPTTNLAAGTIYIVTDASAADRLNIIWLDNSEEATAIKTVKSAKAENGAIFNLAGQKVNASYKGVVIKDGKKYMQK